MSPTGGGVDSLVISGGASGRGPILEVRDAPPPAVDTDAASERPLFFKVGVGVCAAGAGGQRMPVHTSHVAELEACEENCAADAACVGFSRMQVPVPEGVAPLWECRLHPPSGDKAESQRVTGATTGRWHALIYN